MVGPERLFESVDHLSHLVQREPLVGNGGSGDVAAEFLEPVALVGLAAGCGMEGEAGSRTSRPPRSSSLAKCRERSAFGFESGEKPGVVSLDDSVERCLFRTVAFVDIPVSAAGLWQSS